MEWTERLSVGVARFDDEHKKLVSLINALFEAVQAGRGREALGQTLDELIAYTRNHFVGEEAALKQYGYPDLESHHKEHEALTRQVIDIQRKYHAGASAMLSMEVMTFLKNWLVRHIQGTDQKYSRFLNDKGLH
jgi:hemerythrin